MAEFYIVSGEIKFSVILDDPLIDRMLCRSRMDVILLHLEAGVSGGNIGGLIIVHVGKELHIVKIRSFDEPPAVGSLLHGGDVAEHRIIIISRSPVDLARFLDRRVQLTGIPGVIFVRTDLEADLIALLDRYFIEAEADHIIIAVALQHFDFLRKKGLAVMPDLQCDTVRIIRILVILAEFNIGTRDVNISVLRDDPHINRIQFVAGMDIVFLHLETGSTLRHISGFVIRHLGQEFCIVRSGSLEEPPAVRALLHGIQPAKGRIVVVTRLHLRIGDRFDRNGETSAVPCPVAVGADLEAQLVAAFYGKRVKAEIKNGIVAVAALYFDFL